VSILRDIFTIGEILIDFISATKGASLENSDDFKKKAGGAPANVAAVISKLGGKSAFIGKLGIDPFGKYLLSILENSNVATSYLSSTEKGKTALAFVSLKADGNRDFVFYGENSAHTYLAEEDINENWFNQNIIHFGSIGLLSSPSKEAHLKAIKSTREKAGIVSFDPNIRLSLFNDEKAYKKLVRETIPLCDLLKISSEEIEFITDIKDCNEAIKTLFVGNVKTIIYTKGPEGAEFHTKNFSVSSNTIDIEVTDTTGAGDAFIGAFLYKLANIDIDIKDISKDMALEMLDFANLVATISTTRRGAITSFPTREKVTEFAKKYNKKASF
jgi:fructokinase